MKAKSLTSLARFSWLQRSLLASLVILVAGMAGIGWWVGMQIENEVIHQSAANTALYVSSLVEPHLQDLASGAPVSAQDEAALAVLIRDTSLGQDITDLKVWDRRGSIVYTTNLKNMGQSFPIDADLARALRGWVAADISNLTNPENINDPDRGQRRLQTYSPVRRTGTNQIIGAVEFYQSVATLDRDIAAAVQRSWLVVGAATLAMYLLLVGFFRFASDTIQRQQNELSRQVGQLQGLLGQNEELHERVRRAALRTTELNERFLRRISAELHDGPAQDLGLALLRLDRLQPTSEPSRSGAGRELVAAPDFQVIQNSLRHAMGEIRAISSGLGLPELENLPLSETIARAVRAHTRRTGTQVETQLAQLPQDAPVPVKITAYRIIQEGLSNAYRHAGGAGQLVLVNATDGWLHLSVSDQGPGFDLNHSSEWDDHLGLVGMRERVESLGGTFQIESVPGRGTIVRADLPLGAG